MMKQNDDSTMKCGIAVREFPVTRNVNRKDRKEMTNHAQKMYSAERRKELH